MDLVSYNAEDLSSLRPNDYFFEPLSRKIFQYRNREGKAIIVRELGTQTFSKLFKNTLKTILKVEGGFDKYQVINISDTSITLFNTNIGESFELGFGDTSESIEEMRISFNKGDEIIAEIFDYDEIREIINLSIANSSVSQTTVETQASQVSEAELKRIKEIEEKKAKKRPFIVSGSAKPAPKPKESSPKVQAKTSQKETKKLKETKQKQEKKPEETSKKEEKKETKEEKKAREKREKEEQKAREKREKEEQKEREKAEKEAQKNKKKKK